MSDTCTIKDIAKRAGLSVGTVSGVLNNKTNFSDETRSLVWNIANELSYTPNREAKKLRSGGHGVPTKSNLLMYITNTQREDPQNSLLDQVVLAMYCMEAQKRGMFMTKYWYKGVNSFSCPPILNGLIDGVILGTPHQEIIDILSAKNIPIVLSATPFHSSSINVSAVNFNVRKGVLDVFEHLKKLGHKSIGLCSANTILENPFFGAAIEASATYGITIPNEFMTPLQDLSPETHEAVMEQFAASIIPSVKAKKISALFCSTDCYALSLYEMLKRKGINIPSDLSIVGCGRLIDDPMSSHITTIAFDLSRLVTASMDLLMDLIENKKDNSPVEIMVPPIIQEGKTLGGVIK